MISSKKKEEIKIQSLDRRIRKTKTSLKTSFIDLIIEKNIFTITVTDIVNSADINRSTFYAHFQNKEDLLSCIMKELLNGLIDSMQISSINKKQNLPEDYKKLLAHMFTYIAENYTSFKALLSENGTPEFLPFLENNLYTFFSKDLKNYIHQTNLIVDNDILANYLTIIFVGFIYHWVIKTDMKYSPDYLAKELGKIFIPVSNAAILTSNY